MHVVPRAGSKSEEHDSNFIMNTVQVKLGKVTQSSCASVSPLSNEDNGSQKVTVDNST